MGDLVLEKATGFFQIDIRVWGIIVRLRGYSVDLGVLKDYS